MYIQLPAHNVTRWAIAILAVLLTVGLVAIPVMAATNVQTLWSNEPALEGYRFGDFNGDGRTDLFRIQENQWQYAPSGTGTWQDLFRDSWNTPIDELRFGDFNGDGRTDVFVKQGSQWQYSSAGSSSWIPLASDSTPLSGLRFGDFDGDGFTDVFSVAGTQWRYSSRGTDSWAPLATDSAPIADLRFGDFDGDGRTDVFSVAGKQWRYSSAGQSSWIDIAHDPLPLEDLRFGDFDGDGRTDVFSSDGGQWRYSSGGISGWIPLASDPTPIQDLRFGDFDGDRRSDVFSLHDDQPRYSAGGGSSWVPLDRSQPALMQSASSQSVSSQSGQSEVNIQAIIVTSPQPPAQQPSSPRSIMVATGPLADLRFGDFDGDGRTDVFRSVGGQWQYSAGAVRAWSSLAYDALPLEELRFGSDWNTYRTDFNGDGRTDVFSTLNNQWRYSDGGASNWTPLASSSEPIGELRFGDFDGNGRTDVFSVQGNQWRYSPDGRDSWLLLATDSRPLYQLRFGDFDGDGRTDVFSIEGNQWQYSSAGRESWRPLASDSAPLQELRFGDFDGDRRTDVFKVEGSQWYYSSGGTSSWMPLASDPTPLVELGFGDFDADGRTDVFSIDRNGRWRYSSGGRESWVLLGPPELIVPPTPTPTTRPTPVYVTPIPPPSPSPRPPQPSPPPPLPSQPPSGCDNILLNGDMEQNGSWVFGKSPLQAAYTAAQKHSGQRSVQMGVSADSATKPQESYSSIRQPISIPANAGAVKLQWWHLYRSEEPPNGQPSNKVDRQEVILLSQSGDTLRILDRVRGNDPSWQQSTVDLSEFAGQQVYVYFNVYNDSNPARTWMYLDDVRVEICRETSQPAVSQPVAPQPKQPASQPSSPSKGAQPPVWSTPKPSSGSKAPSDAPSPPVWSTPRSSSQSAPVQPAQKGGAIPSQPTQSNAQSSLLATSRALVTEAAAGKDTRAAASTPTVPPTPTATPSDTPPDAPPITPNVTPTEATPLSSQPTDDVSGPDAAALAEPTIPPDAIRAQVVEVIDGRTIEVAVGDADPPTLLIRYAHIIVSQYDTDAGEISTAANQALVLDETVYIDLLKVSEDTRADSLGVDPDMSASTAEALDAYVFLQDGELANAVMVAGGFAVLSPSAAGSQYEALLLEAQKTAQKSKSGMWSLTPVAEETAVAAIEATRSASARTTPVASATALSATVSPTDTVTNTPTRTPTHTPTDVTSETEAGEDSTPDASATAGDTAEPSPTATIAADEDDSAPAIDEQCDEVAVNGGFEEGETGWRIHDSERSATFTDEVTFGDSERSVRLGIIDEENIASISAISQAIDLPDDVSSIILSLRYYPLHEEDPGPGDLQYIDVYDTDSGQFVGRVVGDLMDDRTWLAANYDLTPLEGESIRIVFAVNNDGVGGRTAAYIDDVSVLACSFDEESASEPAPASTSESTPEPTAESTADVTPEPTATANASAAPTTTNELEDSAEATVTVDESGNDRGDDAGRGDELGENGDIAQASAGELMLPAPAQEENAVVYFGDTASRNALLARIFTGAVMFGILGTLGFAAVFILTTGDGSGDEE